MSRKVCVYSGSTEDLNTSMKIRLEDGSIVEVWVSDLYADEATPKSAREAYLKQRDTEGEEIRKLQEAAAKLGLKLVGVQDMPPEPTQVIRPTAAPAAKPKGPQQTIAEGTRIVDGRTADKGVDLQVQYAQNGASSQAPLPVSQYEVKTVEKPSEDLKAGERAEIGMVRGRGGLEVAIPVRRQGKTGTTNVTVIDTGGDAQLQKRFKSMANASESGMVNYGKDGYDVKFITCTACHGTCRDLSGKNPCPKCKGAGEIQMSRF